MDKTSWNERYSGSDLVWPTSPNRWVVAQLEGPLGRDMALRVPYALAAAGSALIAIYGWMRLRFAAVAAT